MRLRTPSSGVLLCLLGQRGVAGRHCVKRHEVVMFELVVRVEFAAAHRLRGYSGECENLHGHNWQIDVYLRGGQLNELGMLIDFKDAKRHINAVLGMLDHKYLNDLDYFGERNPTTEHVARFLADELARRLPPEVHVHRVTAWESGRCGATYWQEGNT